jgi:hypothetical protein
MKIIPSSPGSCSEIITCGAPRVITASVTDFEIEALGAKRQTSSESKSWGWAPDPLDASSTEAGDLLLRMRNIHFTVVRYDIASPPFKACYITFRADWETQGWRSINPALPDDGDAITFRLEVLEAGGGTVETMDYAGAVNCPAGQTYAVVRQKNIAPEIYDIIAGARIPAGRNGYFKPC